MYNSDHNTRWLVDECRCFEDEMYVSMGNEIPFMLYVNFQFKILTLFNN